MKKYLGTKKYLSVKKYLGAKEYLSVKKAESSFGASADLDAESSKIYASKIENGAISASNFGIYKPESSAKNRASFITNASIIFSKNSQIFITFCILFFIALFTGCNSKKYYTPKEITSQIIFHQSLDSAIDHNNRYGATLKDGSILTQNGILPASKNTQKFIPKNARFLNESGGYYIFANGCESVLLLRASLLDEGVFDSGVCMIKEENTACAQDEIEVPINSCVIMASLNKNLLATISTDNSMNIFDVNEVANKSAKDTSADSSAESKAGAESTADSGKSDSNKTDSTKSADKTPATPRFSQKGSSVVAVNELIAAPLFLESIVVFPTLDGRLLVVSTKDFSVQRNIIISSDKFFNNIIYLEGDDTRIFAATPKKLISIISGQEFSYSAQIKDVLFYGGYIYVITLDGKFAQLNHTLREINTEKFPYASLNGMVVANNTFYTFEKFGGFIIGISLDDFSYKVYQAQDAFGKVAQNKLNFYSKNIFYYNKYYFDFARFR
ncbi:MULTISPECIES: hypothetical protein [unclassified Helicobacter]|uniref:hypothetical protein n=1 Tax=unclassified Helicobacter TaxID=2593540 RepID=UPI00115FD369|nr:MULTISPECIES: hypothetical protein [unclassified Helicobacter]